MSKYYVGRTLCPQGHVILVFGFLPGVTRVATDLVLTLDNALQLLKDSTRGLVQGAYIEPRCFACDALMESFVYEIRESWFATHEELLDYICETEQQIINGYSGEEGIRTK